MAKTATEIDEENKLQLLRNPQVDFTGKPNLAVQTGNQSISQIMDEFDRAGRAILVANADQNFPETRGLRLYPDPLETKLMQTEINAELQIARKRVLEDQEQARKVLEKANEKNEVELKRLKSLAGPDQPKTTETPPSKE